jgi:hypothetical protein
MAQESMAHFDASRYLRLRVGHVLLEIDAKAMVALHSISFLFRLTFALFSPNVVVLAACFSVQRSAGIRSEA